MIAYFELDRAVFRSVEQFVAPRGVRRLSFRFIGGICYLRVPLPRGIIKSDEYVAMVKDRPPHTLVIVSCNKFTEVEIIDRLVFSFDERGAQQKFVEALEKITGVNADVK